MTTEKAMVKTEVGLSPVNGKADFSALDLRETMELGQVLAESGMFPDCKNKAQAVAKILLGRELGLSPVYSLQKIYVVQGRLQIGYELVAALINRSDHYRYVVEVLTDTECRLQILRDGQPIGPPVVWTIKDAQVAGLLKPESNWAKYPDVMLFARAITQGARRYCPELLAGTELLEESGRELSPTGEIGKAGEPSPSVWMGFWGTARRMGYLRDEDVHTALGVASLKDWLDGGKTLEEALKALPNKTAQKDADELFGAEAKTVKPASRTPGPAVPPAENAPPLSGPAIKERQEAIMAVVKGNKINWTEEQLANTLGNKGIDWGQFSQTEADNIIAWLHGKRGKPN